MEGAIAGLLGGAVLIAVMLVADALTSGRSWWTSTSLVGSLITGVKDFNTVSPDIGSLLIGILLTLVAFALFGMGFVGYVPLLRRFKINSLIAGAIYGLLLWLAVDVIFLNPLLGGRLDLIWLLVADILAGVVIAWWLGRMSSTGQKPAQTS